MGALPIARTFEASFGFRTVCEEFVTLRAALQGNRVLRRSVSTRNPGDGPERGTSMSKKHTHAIVIGASMGGLLAARALSNHFQSVTVLERDSFPVEDTARKGVPQGRHAHGLLARGRDVIEGFFPGWTNEVVAAGGLFGDISNDVFWIGHGVRLKAGPSELGGLLAGRPVLEGQLRRRLAALPGVRLIERCDALGLVGDGEGVRGVRAEIAGFSEELAADLVVDASGRGASSAAWLQRLGFDAAVEERIEIGAGYTTRVYRRKPRSEERRVGKECR